MTLAPPPWPGRRLELTQSREFGVVIINGKSAFPCLRSGRMYELQPLNCDNDNINVPRQTPGEGAINVCFHQNISRTESNFFILPTFSGAHYTQLQPCLRAVYQLSITIIEERRKGSEKKRRHKTEGRAEWSKHTEEYYNLSLQ